MYEVYLMATFRELGYFRVKMCFDYAGRYLLFILLLNSPHRILVIDQLNSQILYMFRAHSARNM